MHIFIQSILLLIVHKALISENVMFHFAFETASTQKKHPDDTTTCISTEFWSKKWKNDKKLKRLELNEKCA